MGCTPLSENTSVDEGVHPSLSPKPNTMRKARALYFILLVLCISKESDAQNDADVLRYSMLNYGSTARSLSMGNAFGALGADFSSLAMNPAGIALYRRSEFSFSPLFSNRSMDADYLENSVNDNFFKFAFGNLGVVWARSKENSKDDWKGIAFGIGYNRTNDFSGRYLAEGRNSKNSIVNEYLEVLNNNGNPLDPDEIPLLFPFDIDLAWQTFLIDSVADSTGALSSYDSPLQNGGALQRNIVETRGGQGEWDFTLGGNYNEQFYFGATLGITTLRYEEESTWEERDEADTIAKFKSFQYSQNLRTSGSGINLKLGMIYRPTDAIRLGFAIHTPTWHTLVDEYSTTIRTDLESGEKTYAGPVFVPFEYMITTPFRIITSMALVVGKAGAFNVDYEYLNYNQGRIRPADRTFAADFNDANNAVRRKYTGSHNLRAGFEARADIFRFRAGGFYSTTPFVSALSVSDETDLTRYGFSGGIGIRDKKYFVDLAYAWSTVGSFLQPYRLSSSETEGITITQKDNRVMFTVGFLF